MISHGRATRLLLRSLSTAIVLIFLLSLPALAHPLGNTSVNIYERVEVGADKISIRFILDIAEFPALREREFADSNDDGAVDDEESTTYLNGFWDYLEPRLVLAVDGQPQTLHVVSQELTFPAGQGGLQLMRAVFELEAPQSAHSAGEVVNASVTETTFEGVPGWHEIIVVGGTGVTLTDSSVPDVDISNELTTYPEEMLATPLSVREASFTYRVDQPSATAPPASPAPATPVPSPGEPATEPRPTDPMVALLGNTLDPVAAFFGLLVAAALGAFHALTPGHGKTLVAAYLVGSRANISHGFWLGGTVAVTHTAGIFALGLATLAFTELIVPEQIVSWLAVATGVLIVALGAIFVWRSQQLRIALMSTPSTARKSSKRDRSGGHSHGPGGQHSHGAAGEHSHDHDEDGVTPQLRRREVAVLGIVGGLVPSGSALLLLLSSIALGEVVYGLLLISAFGVGMAAVLIGITVGIVFLRRTPVMSWERWRSPRLRTIAAWLPTLSGLIVVALGLFLTLEALRNLR